MNGAKFLAFVEQCLAPTLKRKDIVLSIIFLRTKLLAYAKRLEARGATLRYLPHY
jgi:hypothetical protein